MAKDWDGPGWYRLRPWVAIFQRNTDFIYAKSWAKVKFARNCKAPVAQRIEHLTTDQKVWGSNPYGRALGNISVYLGSSSKATLKIVAIGTNGTTSKVINKAF